MAAAIPEVEVADYRTALGGRSIDGELDAGYLHSVNLNGHQMGAESLVEVGGLELHLCKAGVGLIVELVRIDDVYYRIRIGDIERIVERLVGVGELSLKQAFLALALKLLEDLGIADVLCYNLGSIRQPGAQCETVYLFVRNETQVGKRITDPGTHQIINKHRLPHKKSRQGRLFRSTLLLVATCLLAGCGHAARKSLKIGVGEDIIDVAAELSSPVRILG